MTARDGVFDPLDYLTRIPGWRTTEDTEHTEGNKFGNAGPLRATMQIQNSLPALNRNDAVGKKDCLANAAKDAKAEEINPRLDRARDNG